MVKRIDNIFYNINFMFSIVIPILLAAYWYDSRYDIFNYLVCSSIVIVLLALFNYLLLSFITSKITSSIFFDKDENVKFTWSVDKYADQVPLWVLVRFLLYSATIPSFGKMPKMLSNRQRFLDRILKSNDHITKVLTNESVVDVLYNGYAPDMKNEMEAFVRKTFEEEIKVLRHVRSEMKDVVAREKEIRNQSRMRQMERENSERRAARDAKNEDVRMKANKMLDENYLSEVEKESDETDA